MVANEAFSRVKIDRQLSDVGWPLTDARSVRYEYPVADGTRADYVLCDQRGQALAVVEAKRPSRALGEGEEQALAYAAALKVPFVFLANGEEVRFRDLDRDAHFRPVATIYGQDELERRLAGRTLRIPPTSVAIDNRVLAVTANVPVSRRSADALSRAGASCSSRWRPAAARPAWQPRSSSGSSTRAGSRAPSSSWTEPRLPSRRRTPSEHVATLPPWLSTRGMGGWLDPTRRYIGTAARLAHFWT
jgi:hypothetical protein